MFGVGIGLIAGRGSLKLWPRIAPSEAYALRLPTYRIEPPDVLSVQVTRQGETLLPKQGFLVDPSGNVQLGKFGLVAVAGLTTEEAGQRLRAAVVSMVADAEVNVDVMQYNSKVYYVIHDENGSQQITRIPCTGNETVLDAVAVSGHQTESSHMWISRPTSNGQGKPRILDVNFEALTRGADSRSNFQMLPGDRLFFSSQPRASVY